MKFMSKLNLLFLFWLLICSTASAQTVEDKAQTPAPTATKSWWSKDHWSGSLDYMYFAFEGVKAANGDIYSFKDLSIDLRMLTFKYTVNPLVSYSLVVSHQKNYAETYFSLAPGTLFKDTTEGFSDTLLKRTQMFVLPQQQLLILDAGLYVPTGSFTKKNPIDPSGVANYPYNMQLGSGTYDPMVSLMYLKTIGTKHQLGGYGLARLRTGENNKNGYHLGHDWTATAWYSYLLHPLITPSVKLNYRSIEGISGKDPTLAGFDTWMNFYYNTRAAWDFTPNITLKYPLAKNIFAVGMLALPIWQKFNNVDDVRVETRWYGHFGITFQ